MNELRKFLFGQAGSSKMKPICEHCLHGASSINQSAGMSYTAQKVLFETFGSRLKTSMKSVGEKVDVLSQLLSRQCNVVIAQRIRRSYQILMLYRNLYGEQLIKEKVASKFQKIKKKPLLAVLSASIFSWDKERITDQELKRCMKEVDAVNKLLSSSQLKTSSSDLSGGASAQWEQIVDKDDFKVWRQQVPNSQLYQYRVMGKFNDIPARAFYNTQVDVSYWKDWDKQTMDVKVVDKDLVTGSEVIQWIYKFPYPMYPREYVYVRRCVADPSTKTMIISARATDHPSCPSKDQNVRIKTYTSQMVITPHKGFDENGFTYVMSYCDDPQTNFPPMCYNWMATAGVHEFLERIHRATLNKHFKMSEMTANVIEEQQPLYSGMVQQ